MERMNEVEVEAMMKILGYRRGKGDRDGPYYGEFHCGHCDKHWNSVFAWKNSGQACNNCGLSFAKPFNMGPIGFYHCKKCDQHWKTKWRPQGLKCKNCKEKTLPINPNDYWIYWMGEKLYVKSFADMDKKDDDDDDDEDARHKSELCEKCHDCRRLFGSWARCGAKYDVDESSDVLKVTINGVRAHLRKAATASTPSAPPDTDTSSSSSDQD